jgi:hypothetical protein
MSAAFIVDGHTEKQILQRLCQKNTPIRMTNLNGKDVSITAIAKAVSSFIKLFKDRYFPVFVIFDREGREQSSEGLEELLKEELTRQYCIHAQQIVVGCPDRMIENWMLGDTVYLYQKYDIQIAERYEGQNGKSIIRRLLAEKDVTYHELTVGVEIFSHIDPHVVCKADASFNRFRNRADPYCNWLRRVQ